MRRAAWGWASGGAFLLLAAWARGGLQPIDGPVMAVTQSLPAIALRASIAVSSTAVIAACGLFLAWFFRRDLRLLPLVVVIGLVPVIERALKLLIHRARPTGIGLGFPSGHAMASLTLVMLIGGAAWPVLRPRGKVWAALLAGLFELIVAVGLMGQRAHWLSDILGGWAAAGAYACWMLPFIRSPRAAPV
ncbi:MAG: phosphatase PAP2 family protein [Armatimonadota bacterium]|nr:phosphatase PAP2 family protein [Armatimonadota bacterium]MDR7404383.1 phosphatase PAP2 family protein [Armatimonadota bacterium]